MPHPLLYEVNTRCWLRTLSAAGRTKITLANVPDSIPAGWRKLGFTHIWLMGVWTTGPRARAEALKVPELRHAYKALLPGWTETDVPGSPYAIGDYEVPLALGGETGLREIRRQLREHGLKLVLDFVPNHVGLDHPWATARPELFVQSPSETPGTFPQQTRSGLRWLAHGKDPYFAPWTDTLQLDYRRPTTRTAMIELLNSIAQRCDGVRCDMAMLALSDVFAKTWEGWPTGDANPAPPPVATHAVPTKTPAPGEFWSTATTDVKQSQPDFEFLAEAYWGLEDRLRALGFNYAYDKTLYDGLVNRDAGGVQDHLLGLSTETLAAGAHFLENHDEKRVASILSPAEHAAAALVILGLPGMRFLYEGQLTGARLKIPVQLGLAPAEPAQPAIARIYEQLLTTLPGTAVGRGRGELLTPRSAWPGNPTARNFIVVQWQSQPLEFDVVVVNLASHRSQCYAPLTVGQLTKHNWAMRDLLGQEHHKRSGNDLQNQGLYLDLSAHAAQLFHFEPSN